MGSQCCLPSDRWTCHTLASARQASILFTTEEEWKTELCFLSPQPDSSLHCGVTNASHSLAFSLVLARRDRQAELMKASHNISFYRVTIYKLTFLPHFWYDNLSVFCYGLCVFQKVIEQMNRKAYLIAKEIVESEETFIQVLHLLNEVWSRSL